MLAYLEKICEKLTERKIAYMVSGSLAMNCYVTPRFTRDIDIVINLQETDIPLFLSIFEKNDYINEDGILDEIKRKGMFNVIIQKGNIKIDFIIRKDDEFHVSEFNRRQKTQSYGFPMTIVTIEDLILSKLIWTQDVKSDLQLNDIKNLLSCEHIDFKYIRSWVVKLQLKEYDLFI